LQTLEAVVDEGSENLPFERLQTLEAVVEAMVIEISPLSGRLKEIA